MTDSDRVLYTYNILSGITQIGSYEVRKPSFKVLYLAEQKYRKVLEDLRFSELLTNETLVPFLIKNGIWTKEGDSNLKEIEKREEDLKVDMYEGCFNPANTEKLKKVLRKVESKRQEMLERRHCLDHMTVEGFAAYVKNSYIYANSIYKDGKKVWKKKSEVDAALMQKIINKYKSQMLTASEYRELSRTEPWRSYWNANKNLFSSNYTDEQKTLVLYTKMYDSVYENPECPGEDVINDDDLLDGWMIYNRRKSEREKGNKQFNETNKIDSRHGNADSIFIPAGNKEHAKKIENLNDFEGKMIKKQRDAFIKAKGVVEEQQLPDHKVAVQRGQNELFKQNLKGK